MSILKDKIKCYKNIKMIKILCSI